MIRTKNYLFKIADNENEFEQIHKLNYKTFVEEIPQHEMNDRNSLVDKFHEENTYLVAMDGDILAGMVAVRGNRPFSLDYKIPELDSFLPDNKKICEIRLLAVKEEYRKGYVFYGLAKYLAEYCKQVGYDYAIVSGTTRQEKLYRHLGFKPFFQLVGAEGAFYQPMYITVESLDQNL